MRPHKLWGAYQTWGYLASLAVVLAGKGVGALQGIVIGGWEANPIIVTIATSAKRPTGTVLVRTIVDGSTKPRATAATPG